MEHPFFIPGTANRAEALRWLTIAEKLLTNRDLLGSKSFATRARESDPNLVPADQILAIVDTLIAGDRRINNHQLDWYSILQIPPNQTHDSELIANQYRRLALLLNPQKNNFPYADQAFRLVVDAWSVLSNTFRKSAYDKEPGGSGFFLNLNPVTEQPDEPVSFMQSNAFAAVSNSNREQPSMFFQGRDFVGGDRPPATFYSREPPPPVTEQQPMTFLNRNTQQPMTYAPSPSREQQQSVTFLNRNPHTQPQPQPQPQHQHQHQHQHQPPPVNYAPNPSRDQEQAPFVSREQPQPQPVPVPVPVPVSSIPSSNAVQQQQATSVPSSNREQQTFTFGSSSTPGQQQQQQHQHQPVASVEQQGNKMPPPPPPQRNEDLFGNSNNHSASTSNNVSNVKENEARVDASSNKIPSFWTACPYCYLMYEYPLDYVDCTLLCQNCKRAFQAVTIPSPPPVIDGKEAYFCCWGFMPLGFSVETFERNRVNGSSWTPFSPMFTCPQAGDKNGGGNVYNHIGSQSNVNNFGNLNNARGSKSGGARKQSAPRVYVQDEDIFVALSESSEESDEDWNGKQKRKKTKSGKGKRATTGTPSKRQLADKGKKVKMNTGDNVSDGLATQDGVEMPNVMTAESSKRGVASSTRRQSGRVAKDFGKLDLNVELSNEVEEPASVVGQGNGAGREEDANIEGIEFFEGLDEFLSNLPILNVVGDDKVKAA